MDFSEKLLTLRKSRNLTQEELAEQPGMLGGKRKCEKNKIINRHCPCDNILIKLG